MTALANPAHAGELRYTIEELEAALPAAPNASGATIIPLRPSAAPRIQGRTSAMTAAAQAHLPRAHWFDDLSSVLQNEMVGAIARHPGIIAIADNDGREEGCGWLWHLFAFADAEQRGATEARQIALEWSQTSPRFVSEADFDRDWRSFKPGRYTVGTLIDAAKKVGFDLAPWRGAARAANTTTVVGATPAPPISLGAPFSQLPHIMDETAATEHLNARLFKANSWGGTPCFGRFDETGTPVRLKPTDLPVLLAGHFVAMPDGKGGTRHVQAATWWVQSPTKRVFDYVGYDPEHKHATATSGLALNLWQNFAVQPVKGCWRRMRRHLWRVVCGRDRRAFKYYVRWLAHAVQRPGTNPEVMVVLRSDLEGVGKSSVGQWMLRCFGPHGLEVADYRRVFGDFNEGLDAKSFVLLEEPMFPGDHQAAAVLRATLTAQTLRINPKGFASYAIPHCLHFMMTTNGTWAVPAGAEARRFLVLDVHRKMDRAYFDALWAEAEGGGIAAMLHDLLRVDLSRFNVRDVPKTAALRRQQLQSASSMTRWAVDACAAGRLVSAIPGQPMPQGGGFGMTCQAASYTPNIARGRPTSASGRSPISSSAAGSHSVALRARYVMAIRNTRSRTGLFFSTPCSGGPASHDARGRIAESEDE